MTLTELRYIVAVSRERHFGRAAKACFVSQPTLSVAVRKLEAELAVTLFERDAGEIRVTPVGARIVAQAQRVLEEAEQLRAVARSGQDEFIDPVRLGAIYTIGPYLLPALIPRLRKMAPKLTVVIEENLTAELARRLGQGELDVIVISLPFRDQRFHTKPLYREPFEILMPKDNPLTRRTSIRPDELAEEDLLLLGAGHCFRDQVLRVCPECNRASVASPDMQRTMEGSSLETIRLMVATGLGVTVLPRTSLNQPGYPGDLLEVRPFAPPIPERVVALAWRRSFARTGVVELLAEAIRHCEMPGVTYEPPLSGETSIPESNATAGRGSGAA